MIMGQLKTRFQKKKEDMENQLFAEYEKLRSVKDNAKTAIVDHLSAKYEISASSVYKIIRKKRVIFANLSETPSI